MRKLGIFVVAIVLLIAGFFAGRVFIAKNAPQSAVLVSGIGSPAAIAEPAVNQPTFSLVSRAIDGDTIELSSGDRVRYIGMDAPETVDPRKPVQCFGVEAAKRNRELVEGKSVRLEKDMSERDKYGRLLRYVFLADGTFVNLELVKEGYATAFTYPPDVKYSGEFVKAEADARAANLGLWKKCK